MAELKYKFTRDTVFKLLFATRKDLLKRLIAELLNIEYVSIKKFIIKNPEITAEELGKKFCRLDISMQVNDQIVGIEIQVEDQSNFPERSLFYWAKEFSKGIEEGDNYTLLPRTIFISILGFNQFSDLKKFHSEFRCLEVTTHEQLTDKQVLHFFELKKLPPLDRSDSARDLWLKLFSAKTEEDLAEIEALGVPVMSKAVKAYRKVTSSSRLLEIERMMSKARHDEAQAKWSIERNRDMHWQGIVDVKDAEISEKDAEISEKDAEISEKDAEIAELQEQVRKLTL
ncbi:MAG: Rpn family recombination-promoting nuclease/putative transposase [Oscillospiraceae bacterium]|nr:Rpn family recombination-promoting nuclease/putative transposase [Oscillospiraceae bacterium]